LPAIRGHVGALDSTLAVAEARTMDEVIADGMADTTLQAWLLGTFAAIAAVMAAIGLYSVMGFLVVQRRHELGVRIALGAGRRQILRLVLSHAATVVAVGLTVGIGAALSVTRLMQSLLFGVAATDVATFAAVTGLVVLVASVACVVPARRAMQVSPILTLRQD